MKREYIKSDIRVGGKYINDFAEDSIVRTIVARRSMQMVQGDKTTSYWVYIDDHGQWYMPSGRLINCPEGSMLEPLKTYEVQIKRVITKKIIVAGENADAVTDVCEDKDSLDLLALDKLFNTDLGSNVFLISQEESSDVGSSISLKAIDVK